MQTAWGYMQQATHLAGSGLSLSPTLLYDVARPLAPLVLQGSAWEYIGRASRALASAAAISTHREGARTTARRHQVLGEYLNWAAAVPPPFTPTLLTSRGYDVLTFFEDSWHVTHVGRFIHPVTGKAMASPGYLEGAVSSLATAFRELGISDDRNAALSRVVSNYVKGYERLMFELGYKVFGAVPLNRATLDEFALYMVDIIGTAQADASVSSVIRVAMLYRDLGSVLYMWETTARGKEAGQLRQSDFLLLDGVECLYAWPRIHAKSLSLQDIVYAEPSLGTKGNYVSHPGAVGLSVSSGPEATCLLRQLGNYSVALAACGCPLQPGQFVFRPLSAGRKAFQDTAMDSKAINRRFQQHMADAALLRGHTCHGIRRGRIQYDVTDGGETVDEASVGRHRDPRTTVPYAHATRHMGRLPVAETDANAAPASTVATDTGGGSPATG